MKLGIVLPSRNRPAGLKRMVASLLDNAAKPNRVTIFVGLDDDDPTLTQTDDLPAGCKRVIRPAETTCAKMIDNLSLLAEQECDATIRMDDDFICETRGWDDNAECMTGLGLWRPDDQTHPLGFLSFAAMSTEMATWLRRVQGFVHAPWFPFWFTDTWLSEIGDMSGLKAPLEMKVSQPDGRGVTHGLRDIVFWASFFSGYRMTRAHIAAALIHEAYPSGCLRESALYRILPMKSLCEAALEKMFTPAFSEVYGAKAEVLSGTSSERYNRAKAEAESMIDAARKRAA